jgi:hypothetical protein
MRFVVSALACVGVGALSVALAEPPKDSAAAAPAAAAPAAAAPAPAATVAIPPAVTITGTRPATPAAPDVSLDEKHFLAEGYKMEMRHGEKYFCRNEELLGTRLGREKVCSTAQQLKATEQQAQASVTKSMMQQNNPAGK